VGVGYSRFVLIQIFFTFTPAAKDVNIFNFATQG
jgi:hypothetical protein